MTGCVVVGWCLVESATDLVESATAPVLHLSLDKRMPEAFRRQQMEAKYIR